MATRGTLVGREPEREMLEECLARLGDGHGGLFLVAGDAGAGKTALVEAVLSSTDATVLRAGAHETGAVPFGPLLDALRDVRGPDAQDRSLAGSGSTVGREPESGPPAPDNDMPSAIRRSFEDLAEEQATIVFLDDLHWADAATLEVLAHWAAPLSGLPLLVIGAYRSHELAYRHPLRSLRARLRQAASGTRRHVSLGPLELEDSALVVQRVRGKEVETEVVATLHRRANGLPFYLEELAEAIAVGDEGVAINPAEVVPESVRDAIMLRVSRLTGPARGLAEIASAAGAPLPLDLLTELAETEVAVDELLELGLLVEMPGRDGASDATFRHALVSEALYAAVPWTRRRRHHLALARLLEARGASPGLVASHWRSTSEPQRARPLLLAAAEEACAVHAYRDAKDAFDQALELWPPEEDRDARLSVVDRLAECAKRCGEIADASRAWEEVAAAYRLAGNHAALASVERRLAGVYELANDWQRALSARLVAAEEYARSGSMAEAATERLAAAAHLQSAGDLSGALELVEVAWADIAAAELEEKPASAIGPGGLRARAMGLEGYIHAMLGEGSAGVEMTRSALDLALGSDLEDLIAEVYSHHAYALEQATDYPAALDVFTEAVSFCRSRGLHAEEHVCLACLTPTLRHTGQWDRALEVGSQVLATKDAPEMARMVAAGETGLILANRGMTGQARRHLARAAAFSRVNELFALELETSWGLARAAALDGDKDGATAHLRDLCARCLDREETHYSVAALRWAATFFGDHGLRGDLGACTDILAHTAGAVGTAEATAALAHALGENALLEGEVRRAADQFQRALDLLGAVNLPPESAETRVRAGIACGRAGDQVKAVEHLVAAYHTARLLGARPLVASALQELQALGEDVQRLLGSGAVRHGDVVGLTPREREVLHLVAAGLTNRDIADELYVSVRTVDMHVRNLLAKLGCRTRTEAARRAGDLGLLETAAI